jgi:hypothetical protein
MTSDTVSPMLSLGITSRARARRLRPGGIIRGHASPRRRGRLSRPRITRRSRGRSGTGCSLPAWMLRSGSRPPRSRPPSNSRARHRVRRSRPADSTLQGPGGEHKEPRDVARAIPAHRSGDDRERKGRCRRNAPRYEASSPARPVRSERPLGGPAVPVDAATNSRRRRANASLSLPKTP